MPKFVDPVKRPPRIEITISYALEWKLERMQESFRTASKVGCNSTYMHGRHIAQQILRDLPRLRLQLSEMQQFAKSMLKNHPLPAPYSDED